MNGSPVPVVIVPPGGVLDVTPIPLSGSLSNVIKPKRTKSCTASSCPSAACSKVHEFDAAETHVPVPRDDGMAVVPFALMYDQQIGATASGGKSSAFEPSPPAYPNFATPTPLPVVVP